VKLIFIWGGAASGKLTVAQEVSQLTGIALFHNHLVVDALLEKYEFGEPEFVRLREAMWMTVFDTAARAGQSLIFTFAPESTVSSDFPQRVVDVIADAGGELKFVRLVVSRDEQERRISNESRMHFKKLVSLDLLRELQPVLCRLRSRDASCGSGDRFRNRRSGNSFAADSGCLWTASHIRRDLKIVRQASAMMPRKGGRSFDLI
jgi:hypothetical protein